MAGADSSLPAIMVSPRGDEACNVARGYLAPGLHLAKGRDLTRHPQERSRSVGVVHDEELLGVTSATSIGLIPVGDLPFRRGATAALVSCCSFSAHQRASLAQLHLSGAVIPRFLALARQRAASSRLGCMP